MTVINIHRTINNDVIHNFPFATENDSNFRPSLVLKAVPKFTSQTGIPKFSQLNFYARTAGMVLVWIMN